MWLIGFDIAAAVRGLCRCALVLVLVLVVVYSRMCGVVYVRVFFGCERGHCEG